MAIRWSEAAKGQTCLDVCCGSGDLALMLADQVGRSGVVYGVDFSADQLVVARQRSHQQGLAGRIHWTLGDALHLPFGDGTFDAATMGYGLRNLTNIPQGRAELHLGQHRGACGQRSGAQAGICLHCPQPRSVSLWARAGHAG